jgi:hypothetical protein
MAWRGVRRVCVVLVAPVDLAYRRGSTSDKKRDGYAASSKEGETMSDMTRRVFVQKAGLGALAFTVGGVEMLLTPGQAHAQGVPLRVLTPEEGNTLGAVGETLLPGARKAGVVNFVDHQLAVPAHESFLMARVANVQPPFINIYRGGINAINRSSQAMHGKRFEELTADQQRAFIDAMRQNKIEGWQGPPGPFVYFLMRHDAVDVVYGTVEGIESLGTPYMPHILPVARW